MIKLIPCPKITKRELMTALMEGRRFTLNMNSDSKHVIHWDDNHGNSPIRLGGGLWDFRGFKYLHEITESHWYDDPAAKGKAVKARDGKDQEWTITSFIRKTPNTLHSFHCASDAYIHCEPLTEEHLYQEPV